MSKWVIPTVVAAIGGISLILIALHSQRALTTNLPPRVECADVADALGHAAGYVRQHGGTVVSVLGTGSMAPFIPPAATGRDPKSTIVAFAIVGGTYREIAPGALCTYAPDFAPDKVYIHIAATKDSLGWIMTGLANAGYEHDWRVTPTNFRGIVSAVFTWPQ